MARFAGLDGCSGGWVAVVREDGGGPQAALFASLPEFLARVPRAVVAVDMPIGLPERIGPKGRAPERLVRPHLGERQSSVFSIPSRSAVMAGVNSALPPEQRYRHACAVALATSDPPRAMSKQTFHILPRIVELDRALRADPAVAARFHESHPEVAFWRLNGETPMRLPKKVKGRPHPPGLEERRRLLEGLGYDPAFLIQQIPGAGPDDLLDAAVLALVAERIELGKARPIPDPPERDAHGLPIAIWA